MVKVLVRDNNVEQALRVAKRKRMKEEAVRNEKKRQSKQRMVFGF